MDEKKEYSIIGTVTIGTDEYRDLIESRMETEKSKDYYMREGWKKDEDIKRLKEENVELKARIEKYKKAIAKTYENNEDGVALFIKMFGEI